MAAACAPPLVIPMHYVPSFKVDVRLHEPLAGGEVTPTDVEIEMMSLCSQLDVLCKKELRDQNDKKTEHGKVSSVFTDKATVVHDRMKQLLLRQKQDMSLSQYIVWRGLDKVFPRAVTFLSQPDALTQLDKKTSLDGYYQELGCMNQILSLSMQINSDLHNLSDHKYIAHQLAILYQSVTSLDAACMETYKKSIEDNFKVVKASLNEDGDGTRLLSNQHREWLINLTCSIVQILTSFPAELTQEMVQPSLALYQT
ncbi:uncharacterized protein LOC110463240 [Mizuhopecten yessoensis]|uniref:Uncharacterized protein n=1 Tax=Mizuhopecten yessoensis TaxID=6573 RepID=A0A210PWN6_MIZYE|nr:uncharacterized protein LOC110463240 [Mizuhopecten yessoensis]OWF40885.1 hypothetical protein KP79_PYT20237 [Mizuhopecten yessoensis]